MESHDTSSSVTMARTTRALIGQLLLILGYDWEHDENLRSTPDRVTRWLSEFGKCDSPENVLSPVFTEKHDELVLVRNITFASLCAHHILPFRGHAHVGYVPDGRVVGLSKLPRLVTTLAKQLTLQESLTQQIADTLFDVLKPRGCMVILQAEHQCMTIRGIRDPDSSTVTSASRGTFRVNENGVKDEMLRLIND